jgi:hypothetical protein
VPPLRALAARNYSRICARRFRAWLSLSLHLHALPTATLVEKQWAEIDRLRAEVARRDAVLDWLAANYPAALELCPYKVPR